MAIIDFIIIIPLLWGGFQGFKKGLVMELITIIAFILGITAGFLLMEWGIQLIEPYISDHSIIPYISFILIFILVLFGVLMLGKFIKGIINITLMGVFDKIGGALFGILKWAFALSVLLWLTVKADMIIPQHLTEDALIFPILLDYGPYLIDTVASILPLNTDLMLSISESVN